MRPLALSVSVLALAGGCGGAPEGDVGVPPTVLTVTLEPRGPDGPVRTATLRCDPPGGTHPKPGRACDRLLGNLSALEPVPADAACTLLYGGPARARIEGVVVPPGAVEGRRVDARLSRENGCEIDRWERLGPVLELR